MILENVLLFFGETKLTYIGTVLGNPMVKTASAREWLESLRDIGYEKRQVSIVGYFIRDGACGEEIFEIMGH